MLQKKLLVFLAPFCLMATSAYAQTTPTVLYNFSGTGNDAYPTGFFATDKTSVYGAAGGLTSANGGEIFKVTQTGKFTVLHAYPASQIGKPSGDIVLASAVVYGARAMNNGATATPDYGALWSISTSGSNYKEFYVFPTTGNIYNPGGLIASATAGKFYGVAGGGANGGGVLFSVTSGGTLTVLHSFGAKGDGNLKDPGSASLTLSSGVLYGTTMYGGTNGTGTVYSYNVSTGAYAVLHSFGASGSGNTDGYWPTGNVAVSGVLYGTTEFGGSGGEGTLWSIGKTGASFTVLKSYSAGSTGCQNPTGNVLLSGTSLYVSCTSGGPALDFDSGELDVYNTSSKAETPFLIYGSSGIPYATNVPLSVSTNFVQSAGYGAGTNGYGAIVLYAN